MQRRTVQRAASVLCVLAGMAALTIRKDVAAGTEPGHSDRLHASQAESANPAAASGTRPDGASVGRYYFSNEYDYCSVDADGKPRGFHQKHRVPGSPSYSDDRTFIWPDACH